MCHKVLLPKLFDGFVKIVNYLGTIKEESRQLETHLTEEDISEVKECKSSTTL